MKKRWKRCMALIMAAVMATAVVGCGSGDNKDSGTQGASNEDVTLTFWSWLPTNDQSEEMINEFEKENPNIHIDYTRTEQDDFFEKLQVAMASGTGLIYMV